MVILLDTVVMMGFLIILGFVELGLFAYIAYLIVKNLPKFFKLRKKSLKSYKEEMLIYSENREVKKISIVMVIGIYLITISMLLSLYVFPDLGLGFLSAEMGHNVFIMELIIGILAFSIIPAFFIIKIAFRESGLEKVPFPLAALIPTIFPLAAYISYILTANLGVALVLLLSGIIFNVITLTYRDLNKSEALPDVDIEPKRFLKGLTVYVAEIESLRTPLPFGITPYSLKKVFKLLFGQRSRFYFVNNSHLHSLAREKLDSYFQDVLKSNRESLLFPFLFIIMIFLVAVVCFAVFVIILNMDLISTIVLTLIIATFAIYLALAYRINKIRTINGQKHENEIINAVQMLIDHGNEIIEDKNLKSDQFPIILRHYDYNGLEYDILGENDYIGYFKLDKSDSIDDNKQNNNGSDGEDGLIEDGRFEHGYLVCDECNGYYKLQEGENPDDFAECECGGKLEHYKNIKGLFKEN